MTDSSFLISHFLASGSLVQPASRRAPSSSQLRVGLPRPASDLCLGKTSFPQPPLCRTYQRASSRAVSRRAVALASGSKVTKSRTQVTRMDYESSVDIEDSATRSLGRCQMQDVEEYTTVIKRIVKWQGMDRGHGYILYSTCYIMYRFIFPNKHMLLSTWKQLKCTLPLHIAQGKTDTGMWRSCIHLQQRS